MVCSASQSLKDHWLSLPGPFLVLQSYCWWKKTQTTTWDVWNPVLSSKSWDKTNIPTGDRPIFFSHQPYLFRIGRFLFAIPKPIVSMYTIFGHIYHKNQPNVGIYTIHGSYGKHHLRFSLLKFLSHLTSPKNHGISKSLAWRSSVEPWGERDPNPSLFWRVPSWFLGRYISYIIYIYICCFFWIQLTWICWVIAIFYTFLPCFFD